jgi:hypothetical protein
MVFGGSDKKAAPVKRISALFNSNIVGTFRVMPLVKQIWHHYLRLISRVREVFN